MINGVIFYYNIIYYNNLSGDTLEFYFWSRIITYIYAKC